MKKSFDLVLTSVRQLVEINEDLINFKADITVQSKQSAPFAAIILSEEKVHNSTEGKLAFQLAEKGVLSIEVQNDNDIKNIWYLVLKSEQENPVNVSIDIIEVPPKVNDEVKEADVKSTTSSSKKPINWVLILLIGLILIGLLYVIYNASKHSKSETISSAVPSSDATTIAPATTDVDFLNLPSI